MLKKLAFRSEFEKTPKQYDLHPVKDHLEPGFRENVRQQEKAYQQELEVFRNSLQRNYFIA